MGRISRKKGLLQALQAVGRSNGRITFTIYGPVEDTQYWEECSEEISRIGERVAVTYRGPLARDQIRGAFAAADVFLFPTQGENFGHVIAEALQVGCPVILPDATPWSEHVQKIPHSLLPTNALPTDYSAALDAWSQLDAAALRERRELARRAYEDWRDRGDPDMMESLLAWVRRE